MVRKASLALAGSLFTLPALNGCGGDDVTVDGGPTGRVESTTSAPAPTPSQTLPTITGVAEPVCDAISAEAMSEATGVGLEKSVSTGPDDREECAFDNAENTGSIVLSDINATGFDLGVFDQVLRKTYGEAVALDGDELAQVAVGPVDGVDDLQSGGFVRRGDYVVTRILVVVTGDVDEATLRDVTESVAELVASTRP